MEIIIHGSFEPVGDSSHTGVWRIVEGSDTQPDMPTPLSASAKKVERSMHELATKVLHEWQLRNDMATGLIIEMISEDQE
jgi:hypothetical protein